LISSFLCLSRLKRCSAIMLHVFVRDFQVHDDGI
jgi:hypothetical protein